MLSKTVIVIAVAAMGLVLMGASSASEAGDLEAENPCNVGVMTYDGSNGRAMGDTLDDKEALDNDHETNDQEGAGTFSFLFMAFLTLAAVVVFFLPKARKKDGRANEPENGG